jgi:hypothetical protein
LLVVFLSELHTRTHGLSGTSSTRRVITKPVRSVVLMLTLIGPRSTTLYGSDQPGD